MTQKERFIAALQRKKVEGHVPHFELVFYLTMEAFRKMHPEQRVYPQWGQMSVKERETHMEDVADVYIQIAETYHHDAIFTTIMMPDFDSQIRFLQILREKTENRYFVMMHGDPTLAIPTGDDMMEMSVKLYEEPESIVEVQQHSMRLMMETAERLAKAEGGRLLDGFALCSDYCFNTNPFYTPEIFAELIAPTLAATCKGYHDLGYYVIKHTDGNIMPIVEQMIACGPDALHSLDPQGGVSLAEMKQKYGNQICLIGNVNCALLQTGTDEEAAADVRRALREGMPGYGYIFSTSNCVYTGMDLKRYEMMNKIWWEEGIYR